MAALSPTAFPFVDPRVGAPWPSWSKIHQGLVDMGYRLNANDRNAAVQGLNEVHYCAPEDKAAAVRLSASVNRLAKVNGTVLDNIVVPKQPCDGHIRKGTVELWLSFPPDTEDADAAR